MSSWISSTLRRDKQSSYSGRAPYVLQDGDRVTGIETTDFTQGSPRNYIRLPRWVRLLGPFMTMTAWVVRANWYYGSDKRLHWWWP